MTRSIWKGFFIKSSYIKTDIKNKKKIYIWSRGSSIPSTLLNQTVFVYNGKIFKKLNITRDKIGYKFGCFIFTRTKPKQLKKKHNKKKK